MADRVTFTRDSADRIAKVVRIVEAGDRDAVALGTSPRFSPGSGAGVRFCSWTQTWQINSTATIEFYQTNGTATAVNVWLGVNPGSGWVARRGSDGYALIGCNLTQQAGYDSASIQLFGHGNSSALCEWYSVVQCATATSGS